MKKLNIILFTSLILGSLFLTSCKGDPEEEVIPQTPPTIEISIFGSPNYAPGSSVQYKIELASVDADFASIEVVGLGDVEPGASSGVTLSEPSSAWDFSTNTFKAGVRTATLYYKVEIPAGVADGKSFDLEFRAKAGTITTPSPVTIITGSSEPQPILSLTVVGSPDYALGSRVQYKAVITSPNAGLETFTALGTGSIQPLASSAVSSTEPSNMWNFTTSTFEANVTNVVVYYNLDIPDDFLAGTVLIVEFKAKDNIGEATETVAITTTPKL